MPPTLVHAAFGALLAAALLGAAFDRRAALVVVAAAVLPDLDAVASLFVLGATSALLHNVWVPALAAGALYWDGRRERSWLRRRYGWRGLRVARIAIVAYLVAGVGADLLHVTGANLLYPVHDRFYGVTGWLVLSTQEGIVQTYVGLGGDGLVEVTRLGTTATYHVPSWVNPTPGIGRSQGANRRLRIVDAGWQAVVVVASTATLATRIRLQEGR